MQSDWSATRGERYTSFQPDGEHGKTEFLQRRKKKKKIIISLILYKKKG